MENLMHRILKIDNINDAVNELNKIKVSSQGVEVMAPKALAGAVKLTGVKLGAANILKQEMLSIGADAAVARGVVDGKADFSDVILLGDPDKLRKLIRKLDYQTIFGLPDIQNFLKETIDILLSRKKFQLKLKTRTLNLDEPVIMGILNVTPDSFSDGNNYKDIDEAVAQAMRMIADGAGIIDIGGESTRPGSDSISYEEEINRVIPVLKRIREKTDIPVSIDTTKAIVAEEALKNGADIINDISAMQWDSQMIDVLKRYPHVPIVLMHMKGHPRTMQESPVYKDVIDDIMTFLKKRIDYCLENDIDKSRIMIDPGVGFGKTFEHNMTILKKLSEFKSLGYPVVLGASRKRYINAIYDSKPTDRLFGTIGTSIHAALQGVHIIRVHDVEENVQAVKTVNAIVNKG